MFWLLFSRKYSITTIYKPFHCIHYYKSSRNELVFTIGGMWQYTSMYYIYIRGSSTWGFCSLWCVCPRTDLRWIMRDHCMQQKAG